MSFKIVRNDITKMNTEAIVNTANDFPTVGTGCDSAVYSAAGHDKLLKYRKKNIGYVPEGDVFITPGFGLKAKYIIHAVSPLYLGGDSGEDEKLRSCYKKSLLLAKEKGIRSIAFPLISTGGFGYPKEEGMRIAVDEINAFLLKNTMDIYLVVFDTKATRLGEKIYPELKELIDHDYVLEKRGEEYGDLYIGDEPPILETPVAQSAIIDEDRTAVDEVEAIADEDRAIAMEDTCGMRMDMKAPQVRMAMAAPKARKDTETPKERRVMAAPTLDEDKAYGPIVEKDKAYAPMDAESCEDVNWKEDFDAVDRLNDSLKERISHMADTYSEYLLYLIKQKGMSNPDVYKRAIVDKRYFAKIKKNKHFHPEKIKALCLCVGAKLSLDETRDLLARAGYALSPCDPVDIIFSVYIENKCYSVIDIDILLEDLGLPCIIT